MKIKFYGTRGSIPICDKEFQEFGGNTTCVSVSSEDNNDILIFDAGTGIRKLGKDLMQKKFNKGQHIAIMFSHFHWDHIQGFPFFDPAYDPTKEIHILALGEKLKIKDVKEVFDQQMKSTYFPVQLDLMGANFGFSKNNTKEVDIPHGKIEINPHSHPGGAHGFRVEYKGKVFVFCTDVEHGDEIDQSVVNLARDADVLVHEAQYTPEELLKFKGRGHSSWEQAIEVAEQAGAKKLYLTHHDPDHNDVFLRQVEKDCQKRFANCFLAREGEEIEI